MSEADELRRAAEILSGAEEVSLARKALREAQCACAAASISAGRYGCMLRVG